VVWSFYIGGAILLATVLWTAFTTKEYPPKEYEAYNKVTEEEKGQKKDILSLLKDAPVAFWQLGVVQFFSWFSLFVMWVYTTSGIAQNIWGTAPSDSTSAAFNEAGNWTGVIFAAYSAFAAVYSLLIPKIAGKIGRKATYMYSLIAGGLGLLSMVWFDDKNLLFISMLGVGIGWAAILAMPYTILSGALPASKMGVYMGLFNGTITVPQIAAGILGGVILMAVGNSAIWMLGIAGFSMMAAGLTVSFVKAKE
jgi:maltose/moltooligosaccharide transporter